MFFARLERCEWGLSTISPTTDNGLPESKLWFVPFFASPDSSHLIEALL